MVAQNLNFSAVLVAHQLHLSPGLHMVAPAAQRSGFTVLGPTGLESTSLIAKLRMELVLLIGYLFILRQITVTKGMEYIDLVSVQSSGTPGHVWGYVGRVVPQEKRRIASASEWGTQPK